MTLIQEVERVELNSTKIDRTKNNINTKLVELGGEGSVDLAGVPEKIQNMIINNYKKVAIINTNWTIDVDSEYKETEIALNLDFAPNEIILCVDDEYRVGWISSKNVAISSIECNSENNAYYVPSNNQYPKYWIKDLSEEKITIVSKVTGNFIEGNKLVGKRIIAIE